MILAMSTPDVTRTARRNRKVPATHCVAVATRPRMMHAPVALWMFFMPFPGCRFLVEDASKTNVSSQQKTVAIPKRTAAPVE